MKTRTRRFPLALCLAVLLGSLWPSAALAHGGAVAQPAPVSPGSSVPAPASGAATGGAFSGASGPAYTGRGLSGRGAITRNNSARGQSGRRPSSTLPASGKTAQVLNGWQVWWSFNKDRFLDLRGALEASTTVSGSPTLLTGRGRDRARRGQRLDDSSLRSQVVPTLLELLRTNDDGAILDSALVALGRATPPDMVAQAHAACVPLLAHRELSVQAAAALALGVLGAPQAHELLLSLARNDSSGRQAVGGGEVPTRVRAHAAFALGMVADSRSLHRLLALVSDLPASERELAGCALSGLGMHGQGHVAGSVVASVLVELLDERHLDRAVVATIPVALARLGARQHLPRLLELLVQADTDLLVRQAAALAVGRLATLEDAEAVEVLAAQVERGRDELTRHFALVSLGQMAAACSWSDAHDALDLRLGRELRGDGKDRSHRSWAALSLALMTRPHLGAHARTVERLRLAFEHESDPAYAGAYAIAIALIDERSLAPALSEALAATGDEPFAGALAEALGMLRHSPSSQRLQQLLTSSGSGESLRLSAATGLGLLGDPGALPLLLEALESSGSLPVRAATAKALGLIGDRAVVEPLLSLATDAAADTQARAFGCVALGLLAERSRLSFLEPLKADGHYLLPLDALQELLAIL